MIKKEVCPFHVPQTFHLQRPVGRLPRPHGKRKHQEEKQQDLHGRIQNDRTVILDNWNYRW